MVSGAAKRIRKAVRCAMRADLDDAWRAMQACPWRARVRLAWRLAIGRNMDGTRKEATK
jgi:hypothetical protein